jgi:hypothetical protein
MRLVAQHFNEEDIAANVKNGKTSTSFELVAQKTVVMFPVK